MQSDSFYVFCRIWWGVFWSMTITMSLVYMVIDAGLDPLQMVLIGTALELSVFLFEIPTGVVADLVSRRISVIIGHVGVGLGFLVVGLFPDFWVILIANVFWGISYTFISGAYPAWLSSEVGKERAGAAFLRGSQLGHAASLAGIAVAVVLAHHSLSLPIVVGSLGIVGLGVIMAVFMRESNFLPSSPEERDNWQRFVSTASGGVKEISARPVLVIVLVITTLFGLFSEGLDRLFVPFVLEDFEVPNIGSVDGVVWWGMLAASTQLIGLGATSIVRRYVKLADVTVVTRVMSIALAVVAVMVVAMVFAPSFAWVVVCYLVAMGARSVYGPLMSGWLNRLLPEEGKATLFSIFGQADAIGQTVGGPIIGLVAKYVAIRAALAAAALALLPTSVLFGRVQKQLEGQRSDR